MDQAAMGEPTTIGKGRRMKLLSNLKLMKNLSSPTMRNAWRGVPNDELEKMTRRTLKHLSYGVETSDESVLDGEKSNVGVIENIKPE